MSNINYKWTKHLICPYCNHTHDDSIAGIFEDIEEARCEKCDKLFDMVCHLEVTYSTFKKDPEND